MRRRAAIPLLALVLVAYGCADLQAQDSAQLACPPGMASVPGGRYEAAGTDTEVAVAPFCLDVTEVTVEAYLGCIAKGVCSSEVRRESHGGRWNGEENVCNLDAHRERHPINCVDLETAKRFCKMLGKRLPTDVEWEWAARGGDAERTFPWGAESPQGRACPADETTCPVASFPTGAGRFGHHDLSGNVLEWTESGGVRGGSVHYACDENDRSECLGIATRSSARPRDLNADQGFRCAW